MEKNDVTTLDGCIAEAQRTTDSSDGIWHQGMVSTAEAMLAGKVLALAEISGISTPEVLSNVEKWVERLRRRS